MGIFKLLFEQNHHLTEILNKGHNWKVDVILKALIELGAVNGTHDKDNGKLQFSVYHLEELYEYLEFVFPEDSVSISRYIIHFLILNSYTAFIP